MFLSQHILLVLVQDWNSMNWFIDEITFVDLTLSLNPKIYDSVNFTYPSSKNEIHIAQIFVST